MKIYPILKTTTVLLFILSLVGCATGSSMVTGTQRAPIDPSEVKFYVDPPSKYETIGLVSAKSDAGLSAQDAQNYAAKELRRQAALVGANGVVLTATGTEDTTFVGTDTNGEYFIVPKTAHSISGKAIYVIEE